MKIAKTMTIRVETILLVIAGIKMILDGVGWESFVLGIICYSYGLCLLLEDQRVIRFDYIFKINFRKRPFFERIKREIK